MTVGAGTYSTPDGSGTFSLDPADDTLPLRFTGPFGPDSYGGVLLDDQGQRLDVFATPAGDLRCFREGSADRAGQIDLAAKDPKPGVYACADRDTGRPAPPVQLLAGRQYAVGGAAGAYSADITGDFRDDFSSLDFPSGPFAGANAFYSEDIGTGLRTLRVFTATNLVCQARGTPTPKPLFGPGRAPRAPRPGVALKGAYVTWRVDVVGVCGGLCWEYRVFRPDGYVYTREPERGLDDAACDRLRPSGAPVCETYRVAGGRITIGSERPQSFARSGRTLVIDGEVYRPLTAARGLRLNGEYRAFSYVRTSGGSGGIAIERAMRFTRAGRFTRSGFAGASVLLTDTGSPSGDAIAGVTVSSRSENRGRYRLVGPNTLELRYDDGTRERVFIFLPDGPSARPKALHIAGADYLLRGAPRPSRPAG